MWEDNLLDLVNQEELSRQDKDDWEKKIRKRKAEAYRMEENKEDE